MSKFDEECLEISERLRQEEEEFFKRLSEEDRMQKNYIEMLMDEEYECLTRSEGSYIYYETGVDTERKKKSILFVVITLLVGVVVCSLIVLLSIFFFFFLLYQFTHAF